MATDPVVELSKKRAARDIEQMSAATENFPFPPGAEHAPVAEAFRRNMAGTVEKCQEFFAQQSSAELEAGLEGYTEDGVMSAHALALEQGQAKELQTPIRPGPSEALS